MAITLDAQLLEILACPSPDHAPLRPGTPADAEAEALTCTECGRVYPVRDGIPVLLLDEAVLDGAAGPAGATGDPDDSHADSA
ncbi:Trm112 family protein [Amycolatopsis sp. PS_44_ISF1]|uniref:Trm112 family protein n=1 Tax=Amycolatopsis sp. PS_44_ISF1 TaxID=2974917 RepID=UPI0028DE0866|nr:Trm112 family protein [Amycolatopsis sp. PS_44_ISF1]MDT8911540.1 Trm112 family protein [Amycolatopsis sp. PS_44_ISF1]